MEIRRTLPADAEPLAALLARFFAEEGFAASAAEIRERADIFLAEAANAAFLAFEDGTPAGVATVTTGFGFETGRQAEIEDLYVLPDRRRRGVARGLIDAALVWCRERGYIDVEVVITPEGDARHSLGAWYRGLGFAETGRRILSRRL
ncbi:MAG TPA: GNAT family N-acetyltransferase [Acidimicrobiia bacterium]|nr:GNAT family N-acetyltransferase [Acidimicrobiia bacterium]